MQPFLAADSFRNNSGDFQVQLVGAVSLDAAKSVDDLVIYGIEKTGLIKCKVSEVK
jgi:hypothetical protein